LKRRIPNLPIICDPSHICGTTEFLFDVSQEAMDLNFDGLMLESHINPKEAWSDAKQQVTPEELGNLLSQLVLRKEKVEDIVALSKLEYLRGKIDKIDKDVIDMMAKRMDIAREIGLHKKEQGVTILQSNRWEEIMQSMQKAGKDKGLTEDFITKLFEIIHSESIHHQTQVMNTEKLVK